LAKLNFTVPDMACSACAEAITAAIQTLDATATVDANPENKAVAVTTTTTAERITAVITQAGYTVQ
jgi:copper chaperone